MFAVFHFLVPLAIGAGAGLVGGIFGVSGGTVSISALALLGFRQQLAQGTSMVMQIPNLVIGAYQYTRRGSVKISAAVTMSVVAIPFTFVGAFIATHIPSHNLRIAFSCYFYFIASFQLWNALRRKKQLTSLPLEWPYLSVLGALGGIATGLFGIGGPALAAMSLVVFFGLPQTAAQGMSIYLSAPSTVITVATYTRTHDVDWPAGILLAIGGALLVNVGVTIAHGIPEKTMRIGFAC
ncbi:MAG: sulfite exporter TauE/SafE family protein, partial [Vulcanimicrobiaceae bacterium]